jgi:hypothetical protein
LSGAVNLSKHFESEFAPSPPARKHGRMMGIQPSLPQITFGPVTGSSHAVIVSAVVSSAVKRQ